MQIISLNTWGGKIKKPLIGFFEKYASTTDIFCLQEVFHKGKTALDIFADGSMNLFDEIQKTLPNFKGYYHSTQTDEEGLAIFVKDTIDVKEAGDAFMFRWKDAMKNGDGKTLGRNLEYVSLKQDEKTYFVGNFHGLWNGMGKLDTEDRLTQSRNIKYFLDARSEDYKILLGDFNLKPETKSIEILGEGMKNLIREYGITCTRTSFYTKREKFADYAFISPTLEVKHFEILPEEASDHAALLLKV